MPRPIAILQRTPHWVVVDKPAGLIVHRSKLAHDRQNVLKLVRRLTGRYVHPVHRLDCQVSGCLIFAFDSEHARVLHEALGDERASKTYVTQVRGYMKQLGPIEVDNPMKDTSGVLKQAHSVIECIGRSHEPRTSLALVRPSTGRYHQVRRHIRDLDHPVLGDSSHGDTRVNRWWRESFDLPRLALHCLSLDLPMPEGRLQVTAPIPADLASLWRRMPWWDDAVSAVPELDLPPAEPAR